MKKNYKPKGIVALYYYYRYLLKVYPKNNMQYRLSPEMRTEVRKMDTYSERIRFLCKYKLETLKDVEELKGLKQDEYQKLLNSRNRLYYKRGKLDSDVEKDAVTRKIVGVSYDIGVVKKEIRLCDVVCDSVPRMKEQIRKVEKEEQEHLKEKKKKLKKLEL